MKILFRDVLVTECRKAKGQDGQMGYKTLAKRLSACVSINNLSWAVCLFFAVMPIDSITCSA